MEYALYVRAEVGSYDALLICRLSWIRHLDCSISRKIDERLS